MFQLNSELLLRMEHRHDDGSWSRLKPDTSHHDPAEHDPERAWAKGRIYRCTTCDEQVRITDDVSDSGPTGR